MSDNYAKIKSRKYASDDDAENLLAGILDDTEDVARAEQERIEAELRAKESLEQQRRAEEEKRRKEEAAARLNAEMERLEKVEKRRTAKLEALKIEELKERGEWVDPEEEKRKLEEQLRKEAELQAMKQKAEADARRKHSSPAEVGEVSMPGQHEDRSKAGLMIGGGIALAVLLSVGAAGFVVMGGYKVDSATYSKAVFAPKDVQVAMVEKGTTPIPKEEPVVVAEVEEDKPKRTRRSSNRRSNKKANKPQKKSAPITSKPDQNKANKKAKALEDALNTDVFGGGF